MYLFTMLAVLLMSCSQLVSQVYMPVLPDIADSLKLSNGLSQAMIISYFITLGAAQLIVGPLRDKFGDRPLFIAGQIVLLIGTLLCAVAPDSSTFLIGRILQGAGSASPVLISRTLLAQRLSGAKLKSAMATVAISASVTAIIAPLLGGMLSSWFGWQGLSLALITYYLFITLFGLSLLKTRAPQPIAINPMSLIRHYQNMARCQVFLSLASLKWVPTFLYLTLQLHLPFLLQERFGFTTSQTGQAMMLPMVGLLLGAVFAKVLQRRVSYLKIVLWLWPALLMSALTFLLASDHALAVLLAYAAIMLVFGGYFPSYMHLIGLLHPTQAGTANALVGAIELLIFSVIAWLVNLWLPDNTQTLSLLISVCAVLLLLSWRTIRIQRPHFEHT
ncbi:MFS transporter [Pseudoalteromonas sp. OOF1S-7]|uniref:MFS transporter n=1 Tax=Pseudoalteromonas sp. OOF1S-7 TaxID=2917757 RepID=UPI001EF58A4D|nr:MFS transporter [Pseudoalteromonas sp. OOF1S-7]